MNENVPPKRNFTTHSLWWNGIKPVFVDIDPETCNLDPNKIEAAITPKTTAIMPVHVYGKPCDTTHSLWWNGIKPVFVDIDPLTCNIDPDRKSVV